LEFLDAQMKDLVDSEKFVKRRYRQINATAEEKFYDHPE
jgi:hypothetical protein